MIKTNRRPYGPDYPYLLAEELERRARTEPITVTWLNHWSIERADWQSLRRMTFIGIDGTYLQLLLRSSGTRLGRTSADLVLPRYLDLVPHARVALIGARPGVAAAAASRLTGVVFTADGFDELRQLLADPEAARRSDPTVVVLGLGAGLQDRVALQLRSIFPTAAIFTAGGWIDQLHARQQFFPPVVHQFRVGWLWRLLHEPRRLVKRYTVDAVKSAASFHSRLLPTIHSHLRVVGPIGWQGADVVEAGIAPPRVEADGTAAGTIGLRRNATT